MTRSAKRTWLYLALFLIFTAASVALRTIALFVELDSSHIYFEGGILLFISAMICIIFIPLSLSYVFVSEKDMKLYASFKTPGTYIPSGIVSVALLFLGGELFAGNFIFGGALGAGYFSGASSIIALLTTVLAFICALNFFFNVFHEKKESFARASFCLLCALFLGCYAGYLFFSDALPINAPNKAVDQMAYLSLAIFFLYETRISLGRAKWRLYFPMGIIAALLAFYSSIPSLIYLFADGTLISISLSENVLTLTLGIYVISRASLVATLSPDEMCDTVKAISGMATRRTEDIKNREALCGILDIDVDRTTLSENTTEVGANYEISIPAIAEQETFNFDES